MANSMHRSHPSPVNTGYPGTAGLHQYSIISASLYLMDRVLMFYRHDLILKGWQEYDLILKGWQEYICHVSDTHKKARLLFENARQDLLDLVLTETPKGNTDIRISVKLKGAADRVVLNFQDGEMFYDEPPERRPIV
jgi:hypothetical protein